MHGGSVASGAERRAKRSRSAVLVVARQRAAGGLDVFGAHQRLADEHGVDADALQLVELVARRRCRTPTTTILPAGTSDSSSNVRSRSTVKSVRSRLLMPITSASSSSATSSSSRVVDLHEHVEVERERVAVQPLQLARLQRGDDQQDRVGARDRRLEQLVRVDDEVLAQDRQLAAARAARRSSSEPPKCGRSVSTDSAAAPRVRRRARSPRPSRPRGSLRPTASGACARRSRRCPDGRAPP